MKNLKERKKVKIPKNKASKKMLYFFLSLSELKKYLSLSKLKKIFGGKVGQRKPFVTFCNFLFPKCTPGLCAKSIVDFSRLAYCEPFTHPRQIAQNQPLTNSCILCNIDSCILRNICQNNKRKGKQKALNASPKDSRKKIQKFLKKGLTTETGYGIMQVSKRDTDTNPQQSISEEEN